MKKNSGEQRQIERRNEYIARVCLPTREVNIVTIIIGTELQSSPPFLHGLCALVFTSVFQEMKVGI